MKKLFLAVVAFFFMVGMAQAATLQWDHDGADGFIIYYTDQTNNYNYNVVGDVRQCDTGLLNLVPGVEYTFHATAYNSSGKSGPSNTVIHTRDVFSPPVDVLPAASPSPGDPSGLQIL